MDFPIGDLRHGAYSSGAPLIDTPKVIGGYSVDSERCFNHDKTEMKFVDKKYLPEKGTLQVKPMDLNKAYELSKIFTGRADEILHNFLRWILNSKEKLILNSAQGSPRLSADFVSARNVLKRIMMMPYCFHNAVLFYATVFHDTVYMMPWKTEDEMQNIDTPNELCRSQYGHKFEQYMTGGDPEDGFVANAEYRCVLTVNLGEINLLYAPEVDCADPDLYEEEYTDLSAFIMVKSSKENSEPRLERNFRRYKLLEFWIENQLSGIPRVIVGYRTEEGFIRKLEMIPSEELPERAHGEWDPNTVLNFLSQFLAYVKRVVHTTPGQVFKFKREAKTNLVTAMKLSEKDRMNVLPQWYKDQIFDEEGEEGATSI